MQALGAVVTYDYQLDPSFRSARTHKEFMVACENVTDRREVPDPDHDGLAWLRRLVGVDVLHDVVSVNLAYSHDANGDNRHEPEKRFHEDMLLVSRFPELRLLLLSGKQSCDQVLEAIQTLRRLEAIYMWDAGVTDAGIENLRGLKKLRYLHVSNAALSDRSLEVFGDLLELDGLSLQGNRFTDEGLRHLRRLTKLRSLWVGSVGERGDTKVLGHGLSHLSALTDLEQLGLQDCQFSDAGVQHLRPFTKLKLLLLHDCNLTPKGEAEFRRMHPDCNLDIQRR